jgi:RNA binding exosome subunit
MDKNVKDFSEHRVKIHKLFKNVSKNISMRYLHRITVTVFLNPEEYSDNLHIEENIISSLKRILLLDIVKEKIDLSIVKAVGFENREIKIFEMRILKESHTNIFLNNLKELLGQEQLSTLLSQRWSRLDENMDFFIRLDKKALIEGKAVLTESGDCFHIKMGIASFPKNRDVAIKVVESMFDV